MGQRFSEVESVYMDEIQSKKKGFKDFKNATKGRRLGKKNVMFASDFMSRKEKMKYQKAGEVLTTNMYDTILTIAEFDQLEKHEQKNRLQYWRTQNSNKEILAGMGISNKKLYDLVAELELPKAPRTHTKTRKGSSTKKEKEPAKETSVAVQKEIVPEVPQQPVQEIIVDGLNLVFHGTYKAEQIQKQLTKFSLILEDDSEEYYFEFRLMQKQPKK
jgi:hypothetical protein